MLELWVFWFDERHTGKIDANDDLYALDGKKIKNKGAKREEVINNFFFINYRNQSGIVYLGKCL